MTEHELTELLIKIVNEELINEDADLIVIDHPTNNSWIIMGLDLDGYHYAIRKDLTWSRVKIKEDLSSGFLADVKTIEELEAACGLEPCGEPFDTQLLLNIVNKFNEQSPEIKLDIMYIDSLDTFTETE